MKFELVINIDIKMFTIFLIILELVSNNFIKFRAKNL